MVKSLLRAHLFVSLFVLALFSTSSSVQAHIGCKFFDHWNSGSKNSNLYYINKKGFENYIEFKGRDSYDRFNISSKIDSSSDIYTWFATLRDGNSASVFTVTLEGAIDPKTGKAPIITVQPNKTVDLSQAVKVTGNKVVMRIRSISDHKSWIFVDNAQLCSQDG